MKLLELMCVLSVARKLQRSCVEVLGGPENAAQKKGTMQSLSEFTKNIEGKLAAEEEQKQSYQQDLLRQHEVRTGRLAIFVEKAGQIIDTIIRPRMEKLVGYFENASISSPDSECSHCISRFESSPRFPASTTLGFSVSHDADIENLNIVYTLQILPILLKYDKQDAISLSLDAVEDPRIATWVEQKLLSFLDTYLELEHHAQYQKQNLVVDPVCGMQVNKAFAIAQAVHGSETYYFCTEDCRAKFASEPDLYKNRGSF